MQQLIIRRILLSVPTLLIVTFSIFGMLRVNPDAVALSRLGESYTPEAAQRLKEQYRLDKPVYTEYPRWLFDVLKGDWGKSDYTNRPVLDEMAPKIAVTMELAILAVVFAVIIGIPVGILSAIRQDTWPDYILRSMTILALAVPGFLLATIALAILARQFGWIPSLQYTDIWENPFRNLGQMWVPALILSLATAAGVMRYARTMMLDVLRQDYIRTAWSKGLQERTVIFRHALRNALLPVITVVGISMAFLVGGTVIFESLFTLPGLGTYLIQAAAQRDFAVVQGVTLFLASAVVFINLVVDLAYVALDPRTKG